MTDPERPPSQPDPTPLPEQPRRARTFLGRLAHAFRRQDWVAVALEVAIVIAGVLVALASNAWWTDRQSAAQERVYLYQLAADLEASARRLESSADAMTSSMGVSSNLLIAFSEPERADPDSVAVWLTKIVQTDRPGLALGVARALTSTDLAIIRDDSIRTAVFNLLTHAERYHEWDGPTFATFMDYANQLRAVIPMTTRMSLREDSPEFDWYYPTPPFGADRRVAFPLDVEALLQSKEAYTAIDGIYDMSADMRVFQMVTLDRTRDVIGVLARRGIVLDTGLEGG